MDRQLIKTLIDALQASGLDELEYSRDGECLRLTRSAANPASPAAGRPVQLPVQSPGPDTLPSPPQPLAPVVTAGGQPVCAPLYGIVHLQRAPGAPPFVTAGQAVEAGQVLCTIEAMKVFTDVRTDRAGTVAEIMVADAQEVEAGQPLVRLG